MKKRKPLSMDAQRAWYRTLLPLDERVKPQTPTDRYNSAGRPLRVTAYVIKVAMGLTTVQDEYFRTIIYTKHSKSCPQGLKEGTEGWLETRKEHGLYMWRFILKKKGKRR